MKHQILELMPSHRCYKYVEAGQTTEATNRHLVKDCHSCLGRRQAITLNVFPKEGGFRQRAFFIW